MKKGILIALLFAGLAMAEELPKGPGVDLIYAKCQICHDLTYLTDTAGVDAATWEGILNDMIDFGAPVNEDERKVILGYLSTYLGPNPPPAEEAASPDEAPAGVDGKAAYATNCAGCHQPEGQGMPGAFPSLKGNPVLVKDATYPALVVLFGLQGKIEVNGAGYDGAMPPLGHLDNATVAALVNYLLQEFNEELLPGDFKPLDAATVAELRKKALTPKQVQAFRQKLSNGE